VLDESDKGYQGTDPMKKIPNLEEQQSPQQLTSAQNLMVLKAPLYQAEKDHALIANTIIDSLWNSLEQKNAIIHALQTELAKHKPVDEGPTPGSIPDDTRG